MRDCSEWHTCSQCEHCAKEPDHCGKYACEGFGDGRTTEPDDEACQYVKLIHPEGCFFVHTSKYIQQQMEEGGLHEGSAEALTVEVMAAIREELKLNADAVKAFLDKG